MSTEPHDKSKNNTMPFGFGPKAEVVAEWVVLTWAIFVIFLVLFKSL